MVMDQERGQKTNEEKNRKKYKVSATNSKGGGLSKTNEKQWVSQIHPRRVKKKKEGKGKN